MSELTFTYPDNIIGERCEEIAVAVEVINAGRVMHNVKCRIEMGRLLNQARGLLGYGNFGPWMRWRMPDWSEEATRRWRVMAEKVEQFPILSEMLESFVSVQAAEQFVSLPPPVQERVAEEEAYTWSKFKAVCWDATMREQLADESLRPEHRYGDVLHAIEEAKGDPALTEVAETLYQENRDIFARLSDREPAEVDVEVGVQTKAEPVGDVPRAQMIEGDSGYWLFRWNGDEMVPVAPVSAHLLMWNGEKEPSLLAAFPRVTDGPAPASWQGAVMDAACRRVNASTLESSYGEIL